jgi:hypothetical protein
VLGTDQGAKIAANAQSLVGFGMIVEAGSAAKTLRDLGALQGILFGVDTLRVLVAEGDFHPLEQVQKEHLAKRAVHPHLDLAEV